MSPKRVIGSPELQAAYRRFARLCVTRGFCRAMDLRPRGGRHLPCPLSYAVDDRLPWLHAVSQLDALVPGAAHHRKNGAADACGHTGGLDHELGFFPGDFPGRLPVRPRGDSMAERTTTGVASPRASGCLAHDAPDCPRDGWQSAR